jgi:hypothetical protein
MREWLRPTLGAVLFVAGVAAVAYKVISGYRHAAPDAFVSVQDQNKLAASAANSTATAVSTAPVPAAPVAPPLAPPNVSSVAADADRSTDAQNDSACAAITLERHEIEAALNKKYSAEEGRYMQRRLRELTEQSVKQECGE